MKVNDFVDFALWFHRKSIVKNHKVKKKKKHQKSKPFTVIVQIDRKKRSNFQKKNPEKVEHYDD